MADERAAERLGRVLILGMDDDPPPSLKEVAEPSLFTEISPCLVAAVDGE
jgi:hypothetical protein